MEVCNTLDDASGRIFVANKTEDINLNVFNKTTRIYWSKTLTQHISRECKCKYDMLCTRKVIFGSVVNVLNLESIIDDSLVTCDKL